MRHILVVIDMQNDFISGTLGSDDHIALVPVVETYLKQHSFDAIYATRDTHHANYLQTNEGKHLPIVHCIEQSDGWKIHEQISPYLKDATIINKTTFGSLELAETIKKNEQGDFDITVLGLVSDICVLSNCVLLKTVLPEHDVKVIESCCKGTSIEAHIASMKVLKSIQVEVI